MKAFFKVGLSLCLIACFAFTAKSQETRKKTYNILLDAGHGGKDPGHQSNGISEKGITLKIAQKIKKLNKNKSFKFHLVRNSDAFMSLNERVKRINGLKPDLLISLHTNASTDTDKEGVVIYQPKGNDYPEKTRKVAVALGAKLVTANPNFSHLDVKEAGFKVLRETKAPAVLLELGHLSNAQDRDYVSSDAGQTDIAQKILDGLSGK